MLQISILLFVSFLIGYVCASVPLPFLDKNYTKKTSKKKSANIIEEEAFSDRDIITEPPTTIKAVLTRDRKGNPINPLKEGDSTTE